MQQFTIWCCLRLWSLCLITFITWSTYIEACKPQQGYEIYIMFPEDAAVGSVIGQVKFRDWNLIKQVHSEKSVYVKYDPGTENVTLLKKIDADKHSNKITLRLFCEDRSSQTRNVTITVNIIATNVNDNPPRFTERVYYKEISEDTEIGSTIDCGVVATDGDNGDNMRFSILPDKDHVSLLSYYILLVNICPAQNTFSSSLPQEPFETSSLALITDLLDTALEVSPPFAAH
ncbi:protocadherin Fat 1-like [Octopus bimaculoides]|uniref:protocadherin Fat 1-like n=1 Tax=Octopus bimaculoides TaxID=37653 RepID=UPI00071C3FED|nr:protocadherin Fat 1-like [Octopus bimaculoides]|eukprot:XP_014777025.1 PREDICTED: protocadherin Fat 1-like [Octopus bimaculoides]